MVSNSNTNEERDKRGRGILTPEDRAYLRGETEYEHQQSEINTRKRIRSRLRNAILDFTLLFEHLDDSDRQQVFEQLKKEEFGNGPSPDASDTPYVSLPAPRGVVHAIALFYLEHQRTEDFESTVLEALSAAAHKRGDFRDPTVSIDNPLGMDVDTLEQQLERGDISPRHIERYFQAGRISLETYFELTPESQRTGSSSEDENGAT